MTTADAPSPRDVLLDLYRSAIDGVNPFDAVLTTLRDAATPSDAKVWIMAMGKAAGPMAAAAVQSLASRGIEPAGGIIVAPDQQPPPHPRIDALDGDHPVPGARSFVAAAAIDVVAARVRSDDEVLVLVSGGATSLVAAPVPGVGAGQLAHLYDALLGSGADIAIMNAIRKRFARWGGGRLAAALAPARVRCLIVSDVLGDDPAMIASGPCAPDPLSANDVLGLIERESLEPYVAPPLREHLRAIVAGALPETPKPGDPAFARVTCEVVLANADALGAVAEHARTLGLSPVKVVEQPLTDDAALTGDRLVDELVRFREGGLLGDEPVAALACMIWGGETTVHLGIGTAPPGGRCQELALAAALALHEMGERAHGVTLLAGGTDGRDGTTDAAGAIVDHTTWQTIIDAGRDPDRDLVEHDAHVALDAAGALLRTGGTGTNVQDVVIGVVARARG
jgi:glycerate 2-kinase